MTLSIRKNFNTELAQTILDDVQYQRGKYYYFLGKVDPWAGTDVDPNTVVPVTYEQDYAIRKEMLFAKRISPSEASLTATRYNWTTGTIYTQWDHTAVMAGANFYVMTEDFRVYKCLDNNGGVSSTVKPTGVSTAALRTGDGYLWKYMFTVPAFKRSKFLSEEYIPVQVALSDSFYNNGRVDDAVVVESGTGYTNAQLTQITASDSGVTTGSGATAEVVLGPLGSIASLTVIDGGTGYTKGATVTIIGNGAGAKVTPIIAAGVITGFTVVDAGVAYDEFTTVVISVGGAAFVPKIAASTGAIEGVVITNPGTGYLTAPTLTVTQTGTAGTGAYGNATALFECVVYEGSVVHVNTIDPGVNYPVDATTTITASGTGTGASFTPVIDGGKLVGVVVDNPGTGYTSITLTVNSASGSGAIVNGVITASDYTSDQNVVEQTTIAGAIHTIKVTASGAGYSENTTVTITGNGTGATATPTIVNGVITKISVTAEGSGYTYANIVFTDPLRPLELIPVEERAAAYPILPPYGGHGYNAINELFASNLAISTPLRNDITQYSIIQDFRTFGILKTPRSLLSGVEYTGLSALAVYKVVVNTMTGLVKDEVLVFQSNRYRVVDFTDNTVYLMPLDRDNLIPIGTLEAEADNLRQYQSLDTTYNIDFNKYSGELLYVSTETPFTFGDEQSLTLKTIIKF